MGRCHSAAHMTARRTEGHAAPSVGAPKSSAAQSSGAQSSAAQSSSGTVSSGTVSGGTVFRSEVSLTAVSPDASIAIAGGEERAEAGGRMGGPGDLNRPPAKGCGVRTADQATDGKALLEIAAPPAFGMGLRAPGARGAARCLPRSAGLLGARTALARTAETPAAAVISRGRSAISMFARGWLAVPKPVMVARPGPAGPGVRRMAPGSPDLPIGSVLTPLPLKCVPRGPLVAPRAARKGRTGTWPTRTRLAVTGLAVVGLAVTGPAVTGLAVTAGTAPVGREGVISNLPGYMGAGNQRQRSARAGSGRARSGETSSAAAGHSQAGN